MTRAAYIERVHQLGTTDNGVFSAKLMWNYLPLVLERVEEMPEHRGRSEKDKLEVLFLRLDGLVMLTRRDKVRQAVSWFARRKTACGSCPTTNRQHRQEPLATTARSSQA